MFPKYTHISSISGMIWSVVITVSSLNAGSVTVENPEGKVNTPIPIDFASRIHSGHPIPGVKLGAEGAPHVRLEWDAVDRRTEKGGIVRWEFHPWVNAGGGAMQMNGSGISRDGDSDVFLSHDVHRIRFLPDPGYGVLIESFNFTGDTDGDTYQYHWRVARVSDGVVLTQGVTKSWTTDVKHPQHNGAPVVGINYQGKPGETLILELAPTKASHGSEMNIAIDNLRYSQTGPDFSESSSVIGMGGFSVRLQPRR